VSGFSHMPFAGKYTPMDIDTTDRPWLRPKPCDGAPRCPNTPTRLYAQGWRCDTHSDSGLISKQTDSEV